MLSLVMSSDKSGFYQRNGSSSVHLYTCEWGVGGRGGEEEEGVKEGVDLLNCGGVE